MTSFNVTWNNTITTTGKVFARKKNKTDKIASNKNDAQNDVKNSDMKKTTKKSPLIQKKQVEGIVSKKHIPPNDRMNNQNSSVKKTYNKTPANLMKQVNEVQKTALSINSSNSFPKLIKRKQKKDKLAAKLNAHQGDTTVDQDEKKSATHSLFSVGHKEIHVKSMGKGKSVVEAVFSKNKSFGDLPIHKYIVSNLEKLNFNLVTNVQEKSIPIILEGKNALIRSQTGSGKTLAYAVPILDALQNITPRIQRSDGVQVIIVVPTRELALQTHELFGKINTFQWIVVGYLCGGENRNTEKTRLRKGVHVLIATPGRLLDHLLHTCSFKRDRVRCLVLDEADRLLDMGFKKDIVRIVEELDGNKSGYDPMAMLKGQHKIFTNDDDTEDTTLSLLSDQAPLRDPSSKRRQTILLSATLTKGIADLADFTMKEHVYIDALDESSNLNPELMVIPDTVQQKFIVTHVKHRLFTLSAMLVALSKKTSKIFLFMATGTMVDYHYELFKRCLLRMPKNRGKIKSGDVVLLEGIEDDSDDEEEIVVNSELFKLHGSMDQTTRKDVFMKFRSAKKGILLCTDVVARGIDVPTADCIIQYNGPQSVEDYLHRVGRTGRAGKSGTSYIFLTHEEQDFVTKMQDHKIYLKQHETEGFLEELSLLMEEVNHQSAATALQRHYENVLFNDKDLHKLACMAYSSWSRFYNTYSNKMRPIFDFKKANLGHYVTSFGLKETPTAISKIVRGQVSNKEAPRLNKKLSNHEEEQPRRPAQKRKIKSVSLTTSEFSSGLKPKKKRKKNNDD